jgi:MFS family permease
VSGRLLADITPLRESPPFRRLWISGLTSNVGNQMTNFAVALQVFLISHSSLAVGGVGLAASLPAILLGLLGGSVIDAVDRRRLVLVTSSLLMLVSIGFTVQAFAGYDRLWLLYALTATESLFSAVNQPARTTFVVRLLPRAQVPAGTALNMLVVHLSFIVGPALAGLLAGGGGLKLCYLVDALSFSVALYGVARLPAMPPQSGGSRAGFTAVAEGLRFLRRSKVLMGALLADMDATLLAMPVALFPAINAERFDGSTRTLGLLSASIAIGGVIGSALSGPVARVRAQGRGMLIAGGIWGAAVAGFGFVHSLGLSVGLLIVAGAADVSSVVLRSTIIQVATPDEYRGRTSAAEYVVGSSFPQLGNFRAGVVGSLTTPSLSASIGGLTSLAGSGLIALFIPALWRYRTVPPEKRGIPDVS